jgi:tRNA modification GTPase
MADTEGQRRQALRQLLGALGGRAERWRQRLIEALALVEARIDFSDEGDVPADLVSPALEIARALEGEIAAALADGSRGERLREGLTVAIAGPPNAGKSTLLNRLARRELAIVSPYAGTTRDVIEVHLDLGGWPVTLLDTAGIRDTGDPVEMEGVRRARERAQAADLVLWVVDARDVDAKNAAGKGAAFSDTVGWATATQAGYGRAGQYNVPVSGRPEAGGANPGSIASAAAYAPGARPFGRSGNKERIEPPTWLICNKIDLARASQKSESKTTGNRSNELKPIPIEALKNSVNNLLNNSTEPEFMKYEERFSISTTTGDGIDALLQRLAQHAAGFLAGSESALISRERHRHALEETLAALRRAQDPGMAGKEDLLAEELRLAARALGRLTGRVDVEDVLDVIFRDFCIGK